MINVSTGVGYEIFPKVDRIFWPVQRGSWTEATVSEIFRETAETNWHTSEIPPSNPVTSLGMPLKSPGANWNANETPKTP